MKRFAISTLGCKVNSYESENYISQLVNIGFKQVSFSEVADIYIINSCVVTNTAAAKSRKKIFQARRLNDKALICLVGCYVQIDYKKLQEYNIDVLIGTSQKKDLARHILNALDNQKTINVVPTDEVEFEYLAVERFANQSRAFLKIQDGCNSFCSYCIVPLARGRERSLSAELVIESARKLVSNGYQEIVLTGIHTGRYYHNKTNLVSLIKQILTIKQLKRLRISSIEINEVTDELLEFIKSNDRIARHLHIPIQSTSNRILKLMNRKYTIEEFATRIANIRELIPDIAISTDVIVGFPSETEADFLAMSATLARLNFAFLHVFPYSRRDNTKAASIKPQITNIIKKERVNTLLSLSKELSKQYRQRFLDQSVLVYVESIKNGFYIGYCSEYFEVSIKSNLDLRKKFVFVTIYKVTNEKCFGKVEDDYEKNIATD